MTEPQEAAFRATLVGLIPALRSYGRALGRSRDAADDLVQETFLAALASPQRPGSLPECRAWLFTILRNAFLSRLRAEGRAGRHATLLSQQAADTGQDAGGDLRQLAGAMARLDPKQREALMLIGAQGLSAAEAARICGVAEGTMRARLSRGRAALRMLLDPEAYHPARGTAAPRMDRDGL
jgi:RNA polymerase sigma-70 factor (ECF subfamily)